jgi:hypothetical protein
VLRIAQAISNPSDRIVQCVLDVIGKLVNLLLVTQVPVKQL